MRKIINIIITDSLRCSVLPYLRIHTFKRSCFHTDRFSPVVHHVLSILETPLWRCSHLSPAGSYGLSRRLEADGGVFAYCCQQKPRLS